MRELAIFNSVIFSKLRSCDPVRLKVSDVMRAHHAASRAMVIQHATQRPVRFELTEQTRDAAESWINKAALVPDNYLFSSRVSGSLHQSTRQQEYRIKLRPIALLHAKIGYVFAPFPKHRVFQQNHS